MKFGWFCVGFILLSASQILSVQEKNSMPPIMNQVRLRIVEKGGTGLVPARVKVEDMEGFLYKPKDAPSYRMSFVCRGEAVLEVPADAGDLTVEVSRGPEYRVAQRLFNPAKNDTVTIELERWIDMTQRGWWSGEFHIHRPVAQMEDLLLAEDLHAGVVQTVWNENDEWAGGAPEGPTIRQADATHLYDILSTEDERGAGAVLLCNLKKPLRLPPHRYWYPTNIGLCRKAKEMGGWVDIEKPFWWGSPIVAVFGLADSIGINNNHLTEISIWDYCVWGRERDPIYPAGPRGFWEYICGIWYHLLNCGFKIPASAGSASGVLPNPVGFNRCYVKLDQPFTYNEWLNNLRKGQNFVTNGAMLFLKVNDREPGDTLNLPQGEATNISIEILTTKPVAEVQIVASGKVIFSYVPQRSDRSIWCSATVDPGDASWLAARCFGYEQELLPCAHTSPIYLEGEGRKTIRPESAYYFVRWIDEFIAKLETTENAFASSEEKTEVIDTYRKAREIYLELAKTH
ncbi:MAG TPA: CehA/McbA family metallohydrolase [bacterium]|nr:CehA/McbA family metallohydrolase [bacterium]